MFSYTTLEIPGYGGRNVPNTFMRQEGETRHLAVIYPGVGYTAAMPLLYYPASLLAARGADVLKVDYEFSDASFRALPEGERNRRFATEVRAAWRAGSAQRDYAAVTLVGKSLGTLAIARLLALEGDMPPARVIWLTPLAQNEAVRAQMSSPSRPALIVVGTADPYYDATALKAVRDASGAEAFIVDGANHSLEREGEVLESIRILERAMGAIEAFLSRNQPGS